MDYLSLYGSVDEWPNGGERMKILLRGKNGKYVEALKGGGIHVLNMDPSENPALYNPEALMACKDYASPNCLFEITLMNDGLYTRDYHIIATKNKYLLTAENYNRISTSNNLEFSIPFYKEAWIVDGTFGEIVRINTIDEDKGMVCLDDGRIILDVKEDGSECFLSTIVDEAMENVIMQNDPAVAATIVTSASESERMSER